MSDDLKSKTAKGLLWGGLGNGLMQILNLLFGVFLARLLSPGDYGIIGSLTIFSALAGIFSESGFILAIVNKKEVSDADFNAVFWFNVAMSLSIYTILWFCAPLISKFYSQPEMTALARFIFLGFVASALSATPTAWFFRNLDVRTRSSVQIIALLLSGIGGVVAAFMGLGYWAIAIQTLLYTFCNSAILWIRCPWRPGFSFSLSALRALLPFSLKQLGVSLFTQFNNNIFSVLLGRFYGMRITGFYTQGNKWTAMGASTLTGMLNGVGQPVLRQTIEDPDRTARIFRRLLRFTCLVGFPAMFGLAIVAKEVIILLITDKWLPSVIIMQILCIGGAFLPISTLYGNLFNSLGRPGTYMWNTIALGLCQLGCLCFSWRLGLELMLAIYSIVNIIWVGIWEWFACRAGVISFRQALADILPYLIFTAIAMGAAIAAAWSIASPLLSLMIKIAVATIIYIAQIRFFQPAFFAEALAFLRRKRP